MVNADPARTPTLAEFAKPDYFLQQARRPVTPRHRQRGSDSRRTA